MIWGSSDSDQLLDSSDSVQLLDGSDSTTCSTICADNIHQLQFLTQKGKDDVFHPFMITFDDLVDQPDEVKNNAHICDKMKATFLVCKGTPWKELAASLKQLSESMLNNKGEGEDWECTDKAKDFFQSVYPGKTFKPQGDNKQKKPKPEDKA